MSAVIYNYFESSLPVPGEINKFKYKCKVCIALKETTKDGEPIFVKVHGDTTSNLIKHLTKASHSIQNDEYLEKMKSARENILQPNKKRRLDYSPATPKTPINNQSPFFNKISFAPKYSIKSVIQKTR
jgi:hypothetical protein